MADTFVVKVETVGLDEAIAKARLLRGLLAECEFLVRRLNIRVDRLGLDVSAALPDK